MNFRTVTSEQAFRLTATMGLALFCLFCLLNFSIIPPNPGVVLEYETTYHSDYNTPKEITEMSVEGKMLKMVIRPVEGTAKEEVVFQGSRRKLVFIDHDQESYTVMDEEAIEELGHQLGEVKKQVMDMEIPEEVLNQIPEAERKKLEAMMKQQQIASGENPYADQLKSQKMDYRKTSQQGIKEGYPCVKYEEFYGDEKTQEIWVTDWDNVDGGREAEKAFKELNAFIKELMDKFGQVMGGNGSFFGDGNDPMSGFTELDGIPVYTKSFEGGTLESESRLKSTKRQSLNPDDFAPPSWYNRMSMGPG